MTNVAYRYEIVYKQVIATTNRLTTKEMTELRMHVESSVLDEHIEFHSIPDAAGQLMTMEVQARVLELPEIKMPQELVDANKPLTQEQK
jgi:hypothetical protein